MIPIMCRLEEWLHHLLVTWPSSACCVSEVMKFALAEASPTKMQVSPLAVAQRGRGTRQRGGGEARGEKVGWMEEGEEEEEAAAAGSRGGSVKGPLMALLTANSPEISETQGKRRVFDAKAVETPGTGCVSHPASGDGRRNQRDGTQVE